MCVFFTALPSATWKLREYTDFQKSGSPLYSSNLDECLAHNKTSVNIS